MEDKIKTPLSFIEWKDKIDNEYGGFMAGAAAILSFACATTITSGDRISIGLFATAAVFMIPIGGLFYIAYLFIEERRKPKTLERYDNYLKNIGGENKKYFQNKKEEFELESKAEDMRKAHILENEDEASSDYVTVLEEELAKEKKITHLELELEAEKRLREKYKKMALDPNNKE